VRSPIALSGLGNSSLWYRHIFRSFHLVFHRANTAKGESPSLLQLHGLVFKLLPHLGHNPLQSGEHSKTGGKFKNISSATASRDLKEGLESKALLKQGNGNQTKYQVTFNP